MRNLNPDQLQAFVAVIEHGGFTIAARALNLTQPAVSLQVRELENRCGVTLIDREAKKPKPTQAGEDLLEHARRILSAQDVAVGVMRRHKDGAVGRVRIGMSTTTLTHIVGPVLRQLKIDHPTLQLIVEISTSRQLANAVRDNELEMAIVTYPIGADELIATKLYDNDLVAILPDILKDIPDVVTPAYLAQKPQISDVRAANLRELAQAWFQSEGAEPEHVMRLEHLEAIKGAVAAGLGVAVVPQALVRKPPDGIVVRPLAPRTTQQLALVERPNAARSEAAAKLKAALLRPGALAA